MKNLIKPNTMKKTIEEVAKSESEYLADWEDKDMYMRGFIAGAKYQSEQSEWISVEEALPENYDDVLIHISELGIKIDSYVKGWCQYNINYGYNFNVTHWQPLPNPPQK